MTDSTGPVVSWLQNGSKSLPATLYDPAGLRAGSTAPQTAEGELPILLVDEGEERVSVAS